MPENTRTSTDNKIRHQSFWQRCYCLFKNTYTQTHIHTLPLKGLNMPKTSLRLAVFRVDCLNTWECECKCTNVYKCQCVQRSNISDHISIHNYTTQRISETQNNAGLCVRACGGEGNQRRAKQTEKREAESIVLEFRVSWEVIHHWSFRKEMY